MNQTLPETGAWTSTWHGPASLPPPVGPTKPGLCSVNGAFQYILQPPSDWLKEGKTAPILEMKELRLRSCSGLNVGLPPIAHHPPTALPPRPGVGFPTLCLQPAVSSEGRGPISSAGILPWDLEGLQTGRPGSLGLCFSLMCIWPVEQYLARGTFLTISRWINRGTRRAL